MEYIKEQFEGNDDMPTWAIHMYGKLCTMDTKYDSANVDTQDKMSFMMTGIDIIEKRLSKVLSDHTESKKTITSLESQINLLKRENITLTAKMSDLEDYSKKYNIKIFNVDETPREDSQVLMYKLADILASIDLNINDIYIDNIHRLPNNGNGPRPIIVKFVSALDRNLVWSRRNRLGHTGLQFREHFSKVTEDNIRVLLPIRRAAIDNKLKVNMSADKLYIDNIKYDVKSLDKLPEVLQNAKHGCKVIDERLFFFSGASPLSNFHPSPFKVEGVSYTCGEQYIQWRKASLFRCKTIASEILTSSNPAYIKKLGSKLPNFNKTQWKDAIPEIAKSCLESKFGQNPQLKEYLLSTTGKKLFEAAPYDSQWGIGCRMNDPDLLKKEKDWGSNILGLMLEEVRAKLS